MRTLILVTLAACASDAPDSGGGPDVTSHVVMFDLDASMADGACLGREPLDADPATAGTQIDCSVSDIVHYGMTNAVETVLPQCDNATTPSASTNKPCWALAVDAIACTEAGHDIIQLERSEAPSADTHVIIQCVTQ